MRSRWLVGLLGCLAFGGCATPTSSGGGGFDRSAANLSSLVMINQQRAVRCSGEYEDAGQFSTLSVPVSCTDGRSGLALYRRGLEPSTGYATVEFSDGASTFVEFGRSNSREATAALSDTAFVGGSVSQGYAAASSTQTGSFGSYSGNCPTPESLDAAGRRCGLRSAASRPGGYSGYGTYSSGSSGGSTYVRGYYRKNGTYVRGHTRRR